MAIRYKFRSAANFDFVDIDGRPSISIRDLKSKIIHSKNLNICQDFDLVFSDALTGKEYKKENFQIPSGSSVIIKRVPAGSVPSDMAQIGSSENFGIKDANTVKATVTANVETVDFDDFGDAFGDAFGVDLCPVVEANLDINEKIYIYDEKSNTKVSRCSELPMEECHKLEASELSEAIPRGTAHKGIEDNSSGTKLKPKVEEHIKLENAVNANPPAVQNANLPSELKCSLCSTFFEDAVMIPCCQHSFCEKCIRMVLVEKALCPKCSSTKFRVEDLLPNLSLRQAIKHFLESQILISGSENALHQYAPDGESCIHAKDVSCAVTIFQRELELPHSPSATGRGSNQFFAESGNDLRLRNNASGSCVGHSGAVESLKASRLSHKIKQIDGERHGSTHLVKFESGPDDLATFADFQGESQPMGEEAESSIKKKRALWVNTAGVDKSSIETGRHKKGERTCYMCGSPDHFIRDCPAAFNSHSMLQTGNSIFTGAVPGYVSPYWNRTPLPHVRPFGNFFGNPGMMPFHPSMAPTPPFAVPMYTPSVFGGLPAYGGFMRMGGAAAPVGISAEHHLSPLELLDLQHCRKRQKFSNENMRREQSFGDDEDEDFNKRGCCNEAERLCDHKARLDREKHVSYSEDSFTRKSQRKHECGGQLNDDIFSVDERHGKSSHSSFAGRDQRIYHHSEKSSLEVEEVPSSSNRHSEDRHKYSHRSSKKPNERREQCGAESSWSRHPAIKDHDVKRKRVISDVERHSQKHRSHSESGLEPSFSSDQTKQQKGEGSGHCSKHSRHNSNNKLSHDRWQMISGSDEDGGKDCHCYKRKRVY